ncbi:MAG: hypothetical protein LBH08_01050 [Puniceicoccales bacterium]|nr:hypothetical protein [Puniceicoccales bacterium]
MVANAVNKSDKADLQDFYERIVMFCATARGVIAQVADSEDMDYFGLPVKNCNTCLVESFSNTFNPAQIYFAHLVASENDHTNPENGKTFQPKEHETSLGSKITEYGHIFHSKKNMMLVGGDLFRECIETAKYLKENPNNQQARTNFTQALKKFIYVWSHSSTFKRGQAAVLEILIDGLAKFTGSQVKRPEVQEKEKTVLTQLNETFPDAGNIISKTETSYNVLTYPYFTNGTRSKETACFWKEKRIQNGLKLSIITTMYLHCACLALQCSISNTSSNLFRLKGNCPCLDLKNLALKKSAISV